MCIDCGWKWRPGRIRRIGRPPLAGVPKSTVYYWARTGDLSPSISGGKPQLWSYGDLMRLRIVQWLRQPKPGHHGAEIPPTSMAAVRAALEALGHHALPLWTPDGGTSLRVDLTGRVWIEDSPHLVDAQGQLGLRDVLDPVASFHLAGSRVRGPDLVHPRPRLLIRPGKLAGSPHVMGTRLETCALASLRASGLSEAKIRGLYPYLDPEAVAQAIDLEEQLAENLKAA